MPAPSVTSLWAVQEPPLRCPLAGSSWNERARFIAGLAGDPASQVAKLETTKIWKDHRHALDVDWVALTNRLDKMRTWARSELDGRIDPRLPLIYVFGGPDALAAVTLFPQAPSYLLAGLEPVGQASPPEALSQDELDTALDDVAYALRTVVRASFFRTREMKKDLRVTAGQEISGVLPILLLFVARSGYEVLDVERIEIDSASGATSIRPEGVSFGSGIPAVRVKMRHAETGLSQNLTYMSVDLSNESLATKPGLFAFMRQYSPGNALLKAASFILHNNGFSAPRDFLLANAAAVLEEDSGIPFRYLAGNDWEYTCFGKYARPRPPFQKRMQQDLETACAAQPSRPLAFIIGYRRNADSNLLLSVKRQIEAKAEPAKTAGDRR